MEIYNKLVRNKIPDIIRSKGQTPITKILDDEIYKEMLDKKLLEELNEYIESNNVEELADLVEVVYAILDYKKVDLKSFEKIRIDKREKRGAFNDKIMLEKVE